MIELAGIAKDFHLGGQTVHALRDVDLAVAPGEYIAVMGPSGSGKSTLLNLIALLDQPGRGSYRLHGQEVTGLDDDALARLRGENIGFVFQFFHLIPRMSAAQNVEVPLILAGIDPRERRPRVAEALEAYGLSSRGDHRPDQLSGGQRQRVAIARATIMRPPLLLADEPTGNLDQATGLEVMAIMEALAADGVTLLIVTHDAQLGARAPRTISMVDGAIVNDTGITR